MVSPGESALQGDDTEVCLVEKWDDVCSPCSPQSVLSHDSEDLALPLPADGPDESPVREKPRQRASSCPRLMPSSNPGCAMIRPPSAASPWVAPTIAAPAPPVAPAPPLSPPAPPASPAQPGRRRPMPRSVSRQGVSLQSALATVARTPSKSSSATACTPKDTFETFSGEQSHMDSKVFIRLCKRCQLLDQAFTIHDARLVYSSAVPASQVRMTLRDFEAALVQIASRKGMDHSVVVRMVAFWERPLPEDIVRPAQARDSDTPSKALDLEEEVLSPHSPGVREEVELERTISQMQGQTRKLSRASSTPCVGRIRPQHIMQSGQNSAWVPDSLGFAEAPLELSFPPTTTVGFCH